MRRDVSTYNIKRLYILCELKERKKCPKCPMPFVVVVGFLGNSAVQIGLVREV